MRITPFTSICGSPQSRRVEIQYLSWRSGAEDDIPPYKHTSPRPATQLRLFETAHRLARASVEKCRGLGRATQKFERGFELAMIGARRLENDDPDLESREAAEQLGDAAPVIGKLIVSSALEHTDVQLPFGDVDADGILHASFPFLVLSCVPQSPGIRSGQKKRRG